MEQEKQFEAVLKKSVAMYSMLTGKSMTEREGRAFIEIFDMAEAYVASGTNNGSAADTFDILSHVDIRGPIDEEQRQRLSELVKSPPQFVGRDPDPVVIVHKTAEVPLSHEPPRVEVYTDPASPEGDHTVTAEVATGENGEKTVTSVTVHDKPRYLPPPITNSERDHIPGYDWQICVLSRVKNTDDSYIVHYALQPTQAQLNEHFIKFHERTHYVHVNEWRNLGWDGITERYDRSVPTAALTAPNKIVRTAPAPELRGRDVSAPAMATEWEQPEKPWRTRYYSDEAKSVIFFYSDKKPTSRELMHFHHAKCLAVTQAKPKSEA